MKVIKYTFVFYFVLLSSFAFGQKGFIRGSVSDGKTREFYPELQY